jgi:hypothetical protein
MRLVIWDHWSNVTTFRSPPAASSETKWAMIIVKTTRCSESRSREVPGTDCVLFVLSVRIRGSTGPVVLSLGGARIGVED